MSDDPRSPGDRALDPAALLARLVSLPRPDWFVRSRAHRLLQGLAAATLRAPVVAARWKNAVEARLADPARAKLDLSSELSVGIATVGGATFDRAIAALAVQDCVVRGPIVVRNVAPSGRAFRAMNDRCETPCYVQLGEDMVLKPHALRTLFEQLQAAPPEAAGVCMPLWDTHLRRTILGVKILRRDVVARHGYREVGGTGFDLEARLRASGHPIVVVHPTDYLGRPVEDDPNRPEVVGEHVVEGSTLLFERYRAVFAYYREHPSMGYVWRDLLELLRRLGLEDRRDDPDLWALLGAVAGLSGAQRTDRSYRAYRSLPGFRELRAIVKGGPEEVIVDADAGEALAWVSREFESLRAVRLLVPAATPVASLGQTIDRAAARGLEVTVEVSAGDGCASALDALRTGRAALELAVDDPTDPAARRALEALRRVRPVGPTRVRVLVSRSDVEDPARRAALERLLELATACAGEVELAHRLPAPEGPDDAFWSEAISDAPPAADAARALVELKARFEALHVPGLLRRDPGPGRDWTRCDSPFRALRVDRAGDASGCAAGLLPPEPGQDNVWKLPGQDLWHGARLTALRGGLTGSAPLPPPCAGCHWNHA
jgi:hypothetical protein